MSQDFNQVPLPEDWYGINRIVNNSDAVHPDRIRLVGEAIMYLCENYTEMSCLAECRRNPGHPDAGKPLRSDESNQCQRIHLKGWGK